MRRILFLFGCLSAFSASAREAAYPGYGKPPTYSEAVEAAAVGIGSWLKDPASVYGFAISRPYPACISRGHPGRRDVCGYRMCVSFNAKNSFGGYVGFQQFLLVKTPRQGSFFWSERCSTSDDWHGDPVVDVRDFCRDQPSHSGCKDGSFKESFTPPSLDESILKPSWSSSSRTDEEKETVVAECSDEFRDRLRAKGMSYKDIAEVCKD